jgi:DNA-binding beta-propeller fold protein YncE
MKKISKTFILFFLISIITQLKASEYEYQKSFGNLNFDDLVNDGDFKLPYGSVLDQSSNQIYITDCPTGVINVFDLDGNFLLKLPENCEVNNSKKNCFNLPADINFTVDSDTIVVSDEKLNTLTVLEDNKIIKQSNDLTSIGVSYLLGVDYDANEKHYAVVSSDNGKIFIIDENFNVKKEFGTLGHRDDQFYSAYYLKFFNSNLYIVDQGNKRIKIYDKNFKLKKILGKKKICSLRETFNNFKDYLFNIRNGALSGVSDIFVCYEESDHKLAFSIPHEIEIDNNGNIYIADTGNDRIKIYSPDFKLKKIISHTKIKMPKVISVSGDGRMMFVGTNNTENYGIHKFLLKSN